MRELQNVIRRVVVLHDGERGQRRDAGAAARRMRRRATPDRCRAPRPARSIPFWRQEQRIIERALAAFDGNTHKAAAALEISPSTIYRKLQNWAQEG